MKNTIKKTDSMSLQLDKMAKELLKSLKKTIKSCESKNTKVHGRAIMELHKTVKLIEDVQEYRKAQRKLDE